MRALAIAGPTASGKSACAMAIAAATGAEIISVDSAQVFRGMDIGTAKPSAAERAAVPTTCSTSGTPRKRIAPRNSPPTRSD